MIESRYLEKASCKKALGYNLLAARFIADIVNGLLGPRGLT